MRLEEAIVALVIAVTGIGLAIDLYAQKTRPKRDPGRCYRKAGWSKVGETQAGLVVLQLHPKDMPMALGAMPMISEAS